MNRKLEMAVDPIVDPMEDRCVGGWGVGGCGVILTVIEICLMLRFKI
jgi:hypothetical protein